MKSVVVHGARWRSPAACLPQAAPWDRPCRGRRRLLAGLGEAARLHRHHGHPHKRDFAAEFQGLGAPPTFSHTSPARGCRKPPDIPLWRDSPCLWGSTSEDAYVLSLKAKAFPKPCCTPLPCPSSLTPPLLSLLFLVVLLKGATGPRSHPAPTDQLPHTPSLIFPRRDSGWAAASFKCCVSRWYS